MTISTLKRVSLPILVACGLLLAPSSSSGQTLEEFKAVVEKLSAKSPAGGPKKNSNAAVLVFLRKSKKLCWVKDGKVVSVDIVPTREPDDAKEGGPTPVGEYLIGKRYQHEKHKIDWYKLYPRKEDDSGYYKYDEKTKAGRFAMGLHPGSVSLGCVTVKSAETPYHNAAAWKQVRQQLDAGKLTYKNDDFSGFLYVEDK